ncbi:MAG: PRD domain-containing protein [Lachnospiraceae bacterium]|nr:PRD domain-containing protein [Lachnospiraceae bacterium]
MRIEKIINNNIISARDDKGIELVAMGKGIGFGRRAGEEVEESKIEKVFRLENIDDTEYFKSLLASLPIEFVRLSNQIISYAKETLGFELNSNIYLGLTDHINFAIERQKKGMVFSNALHDEIKLFYPNEYLVGKHALYLIENQTGCLLPEDEAASIALHIVNAELDSEISTTFVITKMMREMMEIIEEKMELTQKAEYPRDVLIANIKYLAKRLISEEPLRGREDALLYQFVKENYPEESVLIDRVNQYIEKAYQCSMTEEEKLYLVLNVKRVNDLYER